MARIIRNDVSALMTFRKLEQIEFVGRWWSIFAIDLCAPVNKQTNKIERMGVCSGVTAKESRVMNFGRMMPSNLSHRIYLISARMDGASAITGDLMNGNELRRARNKRGPSESSFLLPPRRPS